MTRDDLKKVIKIMSGVKITRHGWHNKKHFYYFYDLIKKFLKQNQLAFLPDGRIMTTEFLDLWQDETQKLFACDVVRQNLKVLDFTKELLY